MRVIRAPDGLCRNPFETAGKKAVVLGWAADTLVTGYARAIPA